MCTNDQSAQLHRVGGGIDPRNQTLESVSCRAATSPTERHFPNRIPMQQRSFSEKRHGPQRLSVRRIWLRTRARLSSILNNCIFLRCRPSKNLPKVPQTDTICIREKSVISRYSAALALVTGPTRPAWVRPSTNAPNGPEAERPPVPTARLLVAELNG